MANSPDHSNAALKPEVAKPKLPPMFKVLLLNDDYTPMEFVVETIERFFNKSREDIAETKMNQVMMHAKEYQHPLQCITELA